MLSLPGSQSSAGEGSVYATARTSPIHAHPARTRELSSDDDDDDAFEDSLAHLSPEADLTANATVLENSALMASLLQQKLQRVANESLGLATDDVSWEEEGKGDEEPRENNTAGIDNGKLRLKSIKICLRNEWRIKNDVDLDEICTEINKDHILFFQIHGK